MIDTCTWESPSLTEEQAKACEKFCNKFIGFELENGGVLYEFTKGNLVASYDSRISMQIKRERLIESYNSTKRVYEHDTETDRTVSHVVGKKTMISEPSEPYLIVECSAHKAMLGHNVYGGPIDFQLTSKWIIKLIEDFVNIKLPDYTQWLVRRIDIAEIFDLGSFEAVQSYIGGMNHCAFPRRKISKYGQETIYAAGSKTTVKFYHKGPEFSKHDRKKLLRFLNPNLVNDLQIKANNLLRIEVEIKSKKFRELFNGELPKVEQISQNLLSGIYDKEVFKMIREAQDKDEKEIYRTTDTVLNRLNNIYPDRPRFVRSLYATWLRLSINGEEKTQELMSRSMFYQHRKALVDARINWLQTDIALKEDYSLVPVDFKPVMSDIRRQTREHDDVINLLRAVA